MATPLPQSPSPPPFSPPPSAPSPLSYTLQDKTPSHGWVKCIMVDLYKEGLKHKRGPGIFFNAEVAGATLDKIVKQTDLIAKGDLLGPLATPQEDTINCLALLAINLGDTRLLRDELLEEIQALPETLKNKLLGLEGVREDPRRLAWFRNAEGVSLLDALIAHPEGVEVENFSPREMAPSTFTNLSQLEAEIQESARRFLAGAYERSKDKRYSPLQLHRFAQLLYPDSEEGRFEFAKVVASSDAVAVEATLEGWGILAEERRAELAGVIASREGKLLCRDIARFGITSPEKRLHLAILVAKSNPDLTAGDFEAFKLTAHPDLMRFVELFSEKGLSGIAPFLKMLAPEERLTHLRRLAQKESWSHFRHAGSACLQLLSLEERRDYVYQMVKETPAAFEELAKSFFEDDLSEVRKLLFFLAEEHPYAVLWDIRGILPLFEGEDRLKLIKLLAKAGRPSSEELELCGVRSSCCSWGAFLKERPWLLPLREAGITDRRELLEITELLGKHFPEALSLRYVQNVFAPFPTSCGVEEMRLLARYSPHVLLPLLHFLPLPSEEVQVELAKESAKAKFLTDNECHALGFDEPPNTVVEELRFRSFSEKDRLEIVKLLAAVPRRIKYQETHSLAAHIREFKISDSKERAEVAKIEAKVNPDSVAANIENYDLTEEERFEVALVIARVDASTLAEIWNFRLTSQDKLFQIAWTAAENPPPSGVFRRSDIFDAFEIHDHPQSFSWAKKIAPYYARGLSFYVSHIPESLRGTQEERVLLAKQVALLAPFSSPPEWGITDPTELSEIQVACHVSKGANSQYFPLDDESLAYVNTCQEKWFNESLQKWFKKFDQEMREKVEKAEEEEEKIYYSNLLQEKAFLIARIGLWLEVNQVALPLSNKIKETLSQIVRHRNKEVAMSLASIFCQEVVPRPDKRAWFEERADSRVKQFPMIILAALGASGKEEASFEAFIKAGRLSLRNGNKPDQQILIQALLALKEVRGCSDSVKLALIEEVTSLRVPPNQLYREGLECFSALAVYCQIVKEPSLEGLLSKGRVEEINRRIMASLKTERVMDLTKVDNFAQKYGKTFALTRVPNALLIYAASLPKEVRLQEAISRYTKSVLEGEEAFKRERYSTKQSAHLATIATAFPEVWVKWQLGGEAESIAPYLPARGEGETFDFKSFFLEKLKDNHDRGAFTTLRKYLENPTPEVLGACREALEGRPPQEAEAEKLLLQLCSTEGDSPFELLQEIKKLLPQDWELQNDLSGAEAILSEKTNPKGMQVVDTDNWQDLLLAGTEVPGSCQRIDGAPQLNKCLLAYMLDGKNRMIAVKDGSGKLVGRAIFRLLLDSAGKPALFLERSYTLGPELEQAIRAFAKKRAGVLGLPLFWEHSGGGILRSLSSSVPYEYVDAGHQGVTNGVFTIKTS